MLSFLLASLLIELTPGPNMAWLASVALAKGRRPALFAGPGMLRGLAIADVVGVVPPGGAAAGGEVEALSLPALR